MRTQTEDRDWRRTLELPAEIKAPLTELAARRERTVGAEIRIALREHLERHDWRSPRHVGEREHERAGAAA